MVCLGADYKVGFSMALNHEPIEPTPRKKPQSHLASSRCSVILWNMALKISVLVTPGAKQEGITKVSQGIYRIAVHAPAQEGKANRALIGLLAKYLSVPQSAIRIVRGHSARQKIIEIDA